MIRTLNEIETGLRKAARGAGLAVGAAEDVGRAAAWLAARGLDGVGAGLLGLRGPFEPAAPEACGGDLQFREARAAMAGIAALDLLVAGAAGGRVRLAELDAPLLLVGLAGVAAEAHAVGFAMDFGACRAMLGPGVFRLDGALPGPGGAAVVEAAPGAFPGAPCEPVACGTEVPDAAWAEVQRLAALTCVPASDDSRLRGAGAGLRDND